MSSTATSSPECELEITDVAFGGDGVGRVDGRVVFVPFVLAGERVRARVSKRKHRFLFAEPLEVLTPSVHRTCPFCPYFGQCGGCQYQHVTYEEQLRIKHKQLVDILTRLGGFSPELPVAPMLPSPRQTRYRNRIDLHPAADGTYGFCVRKRPRDIFTLHDCPLFELQQDFSHYPLRRPNQLLVVRTHAGAPYCYFKDDRNNVTSEAFDLATQAPLGVTDAVFDVAGMRLVTHYASFFQVNRWILPTFLDIVLRTAAPEPSWRAVDLYCGVGIFTLALAPYVAQITGVELHSESIVRADRNARAAAQTNVSFAAEAAESWLARAATERRSLDLCVMDPPRTGLTNKVVSALKKLAPRVIVYISCGPDTFARDARKFVDAGYNLTAVQPLDLFPHTKHFELVARLERPRS
ncbi:MAG: TRAM domain-containing protein [bacterium]|nr:TRAM domain-containing protein [bacterium]